MGLNLDYLQSGLNGKPALQFSQLLLDLLGQTRKQLLFDFVRTTFMLLIVDNVFDKAVSR